MAPPSPLADPLALVGTTIAEKYLVEGVVGEGGFAVVYKAMHNLWKRPVAVKVFKALADVRPEQRAKLLDDFIEEGRLLAELSERSAAICQARDIGMYKLPSGDEVPYMVLEWLEGAALEDVLADEVARGAAPRTLEQVVRLLDSIAEALALAHAKGIAHRDMKPANVFVLGDPSSDTCTVKLLDFGVAKVVQDVQKMAGAFSKTSGQITSFTPLYGAPEQFNRSFGATGPWTDVFALALVAVEVLTHKEPLSGDNLMQLAVASADAARRPTPRTMGVTVSDEVERVFLRALAVSPNDRHPTAGEFWNDLRAAMKLEPMRSISSRQPAKSSPKVTPIEPPSVSSVESLKAISDPRQPVHSEQRTAPATSASAAATAQIDPARPKTGLIAVALLAVAIGGGGYYFVTARTPDPTSTLAATASAPPSALASATPSARASAIPAAAAKSCPPGMLRIPGGQFFMGSGDKNALEFEKPQHQVKLAAFCIDELEVTTERYKTCSDEGACKPNADFNEWSGITERDRKIYDPLCNRRDPTKRARYPMNCVDWPMAEAFCTNAGGRLPTEAEWEFAARGPDGRTYPWGDEPPSHVLLNACGKECVDWGKKSQVEPALTMMYADSDGFANTAPVGSFPKGKSRYGVQDVVGNVWEWVADYYAPYASDGVTDPKGPSTGTERVIRGGAWNGSEPSWVRPTFRFKDDPAKRSHGVGFRCAMSL